MPDLKQLLTKTKKELRQAPTIVLCRNIPLATRGLEEPFFQLSVFWFWREIGFGFTYYLCIYARGLAKILLPNTSGYIVGTYIISD